MTADNHRTRWTLEEDEFLQAEWDGTRETAAIIAGILGRTANATAQRHYELEWGTAADPVEIKPEPGELRVTTTRIIVTRTEWVGEVCPRCHTIMSANGECWC